MTATVYSCVAMGTVFPSVARSLEFSRETGNQIFLVKSLCFQIKVLRQHNEGSVKYVSLAWIWSVVLYFSSPDLKRMVLGTQGFQLCLCPGSPHVHFLIVWAIIRGCVHTQRASLLSTLGIVQFVFTLYLLANRMPFQGLAPSKKSIFCLLASISVCYLFFPTLGFLLIVFYLDMFYF